MSFRRRDYPEVLETMLTGLAGGTSAEAHPFPPPGDGTRTMLDAPPARRLVSVHGARNGLSHRFRAGTDVELSGDGTALIWKEAGNQPDAGTLFEVNYLRRDGATQLTDFEVGSVTRTLVESIARETARVHAELEGVYRAGFLDTATGRALDNVVALLGVTRVPGGRAVTEVRFQRDDAATGAITIPQGTRIIDAEVTVEYETVEPVTMTPAQKRISVEARDVEPGNSPVGAEVLTLLPIPIAGIVSVTNPAPAARGAEAERDAELRDRARAFLQGSERGTLGALRAALARQGLQGEIEEPSDRPGVVVVRPVAEALSPERHAQLLRALDEARPAGVRLELAGVEVPVGVDLSVRVTTRTGLAEPDRRAAHEAVRAAVTGYFGTLPVKDNASINRIVGDVLAVPGVEDVTLLSADLLLGSGPENRLDAAGGVIDLAGVATALSDVSISDPLLPTRSDLAVSFPAAEAVPDVNAVTAALDAAFSHLSDRAADGGSEAERTLSFGKLLHVLPAPVGDGATLAAFDAASPQPALPVDAGVYSVSLFLEQANGLTRVLSADGDAYVLSEGERLSLGAVSIEAEG
ncbi:baseplate J/gp47 family protein [Sulfitobacter sp. D35]|uniref:baseplate J/gp47 family protein n=1 Tax=Sulfitobacter sp. D35 TaxID=3083252 RepID=UPI00296E39D0|nr:baseplate J/gp47 family protein [Sulfitobacter sp. D35]MDW4498770.1 baseplate J/gp47 family protein [Sulfitobacter sp. D35]